MTTQLTQEMAYEYGKAASYCPYCGSGDIEGDEVECEGDERNQNIHCCGCHKNWTDIYVLQKICDTEYNEFPIFPKPRLVVTVIEDDFLYDLWIAAYLYPPVTDHTHAGSGQGLYIRRTDLPLEKLTKEEVDTFMRICKNDADLWNAELELKWHPDLEEKMGLG
jgi:hypothetical protein